MKVIKSGKDVGGSLLKRQFRVLGRFRNPS